LAVEKIFKRHKVRIINYSQDKNYICCRVNPRTHSSDIPPFHMKEEGSKIIFILPSILFYYSISVRMASLMFVSFDILKHSHYAFETPRNFEIFSVVNIFYKLFYIFDITRDIKNGSELTVFVNYIFNILFK